MFKLFALTAGMLQVSQSVSLEHMQEIANLQDIQTELPQFWDNFKDWVNYKLNIGYTPATPEELAMFENAHRDLLYRIKYRDDAEFRAEEDARKEEEGEDFEPNYDALNLAQKGGPEDGEDQQEAEEVEESLERAAEREAYER